MVCVYCSFETKVINSRKHSKRSSVWRRRSCPACGSVFTTVEQPDLAAGLAVVKQTAHLEPFSAEKLFLSIHNACQHRKTAISDAKALTDTVIARLNRHIKDGTINSTAIRMEAAQVLRQFDKAANVHYIAHHSSYA